MRSAFEQFNLLNKDVSMKCKVISMDVKALYPSMMWKDIVVAVKEMIPNSLLDVKNVDWHQVGKYLAVMMSKE